MKKNQIIGCVGIMAIILCLPMTVSANDFNTEAYRGPGHEMEPYHQTVGPGAEDPPEVPGDVTQRITNTAIAGVSVPFYNESPVTAITPDPQYTATVVWSITGTSFPITHFERSDVHTATITLTPGVGYTALGAADFTVSGATAVTTINPDGTAVITADFPGIDQYHIDSNGMITAYSGPLGDVVIPDTVDGITVKAIGQGAFMCCNKLTSIRIPASVESIDFIAFSYCSGLYSVEFESGSKLTDIGNGAFDSCLQLVAIQIPASVRNIDNQAFNGCGRLSRVAFEADSGLTNIRDDAFNSCLRLTDIQIPARVTTIGTGAFKDTGLTGTLTIPQSVTSIGAKAFYNNDLMKLVIEEGSALEIKADAFGSDKMEYSNGITKITLPENVIINETNAYTMGKYGAGFNAVYKNVTSGGKGTYTYTRSTWKK